MYASMVNFKILFEIIHRYVSKFFLLDLERLENYIEL